MTDAELAELPIESLAHPEGAWLFMWATTPKLPDAIALGARWGFVYSGSGFVWIKTTASGKLHFGMGHTTRKNAEICLLFKTGKPKRQSAGVPEVIMAPVREHSRKPDEIYDRIERFCAGPYAEVFARTRHTGWDSFGDQVGVFPDCG
jgi:N6-adenosine-specific RNA methylase IME4